MKRPLMSSIVRWLWVVCGTVFLIAAIVTAVRANMVISDIRGVTSQMTIEDVRQVLDIMEMSMGDQGL